MKRWYLVLILLLMVLAYSCIAGCTGNGGNYGSTSKPAIPDITPEVSPPPVSPASFPSSVSSGSAVPISASPYGAQTVTIESR